MEESGISTTNTSFSGQLARQNQIVSNKKRSNKRNLEVNAHDTSQGSHYYPIVSARAINPSLIGTKLYELPAPFVEQEIESTTPESSTTQAQELKEENSQKEENNQPENAQPANSASISYVSIASAITCLLFVNLIRHH